MPHGNFDQPPETMERSSNGDSVEGCGPLSWDGDDEPARIVTITHVDIKQPSTGAHAVSDHPRPFQRSAGNPPPPPDWMVPDIPSRGPARFEDGSAEAFAVVDVELEGGHHKQERWPKTGTVTVQISSA